MIVEVKQRVEENLKHIIGDYTFATSLSNNTIIVFKKNAIADVHVCKDYDDMMRIWEKIKKRKKVIWKK